MKEARKNKFNINHFIVAFTIIVIIQSLLSNSVMNKVSYSEFMGLLKDGKIKEVLIYNDELRGVLHKTSIDDSQKGIVSTYKVESSLANYLDQYNAKYTKVRESTFFRDLFAWIFPFIIFFGIWIFISRRFMSQGGGQFMNIGKSRAKIFVEKDIKISFDDVAGIDEAKAELEEIISFLKNPVAHGRLGAKMPRGVLLVGPPGTGKTLLAKAVAGEAKVPFFSISGSEFVEMFVGVGAARVRDLFEQARKQAPCIIFIDELDALGKARGVSGFSGGHDEKEQTLNQLLVELDGFDTSSGIVLLAATNRPEILDPALLRAGRFDRQVLVDRPDKPGRLEILKVHSKKVKTQEDLSLEKVAALTPGFTGADLANLVNEAALCATRQNREFVTLEDFNIAIERIVAGLEKKSRVLNVKERKTVAFHEMGHAFVSAALSDSEKVHKVSIIPRGLGALGYTIQRPIEDRYLMTMDELKNKMAVLLGGRASEKLFFHEISTGSADDVAKVTGMARDIVTRYAMIPELGHVTFEENQNRFLQIPVLPTEKKSISENTIAIIDEEVKKLTDLAFEKAFNLLDRNKELLQEASEDLLKCETLNEEDLKKYFSRLKI